MSALAAMSTADLRDLVGSFDLALRSERKAAGTIKSYRQGIAAWLDYADEQGVPPLDRDTLRGFMAHLLDDLGRKGSTVNARLAAVQRFAQWLVDEGEVERYPFENIKRPKLDEDVVEPLDDADVLAMIRACAVPRGAHYNEQLVGRRDEAILRLMLECGARAGEVVAMGVDDIDLQRGLATIRRGKGGKGRVVPFGPQTATAIDRYLRLRRQHKRATDSDALWLGGRGHGFEYDALHTTLEKRALQAGVAGFHPHRMRHTAAHRWLDKGGSESGLMAVAGWSRSDMLRRYTKAQASKRAAAEARTLNLGDLSA